MRMRKKGWAQDFLDQHSKAVFEPETFRQRPELAHYAKHVCEIGSGKGRYLSEMAKLYPDALWIGYEKDRNASASALRYQDFKENSLWIIDQAEKFNAYFEAESLDIVHLNFSDPWPKKAHHKRRLTSEGTMKLILDALKKQGEVKMKTDNKDLFEYSCVQMAKYPLQLTEFSVDYRRDEHPEDVITEYEAYFMDLGQVIYRAVWRKL